MAVQVYLPYGLMEEVVTTTFHSSRNHSHKSLIIDCIKQISDARYWNFCQKSDLVHQLLKTDVKHV